jgi:phosphatidylserine decarboxylase
VVAPADGKVTAVRPANLNGKEYIRLSIFLNVFNVHVNRSPMGGVIRAAKYQEGKFLNAMNEACADLNEQNTVTVEGEEHTLVFKQIAGLLARRVVFTKKVGDTVDRGERIGLMKFSSRMDVFLEPSATIQVRAGDHVKGGSSVLARLSTESRQSEKSKNQVSQGAR